MAKNEVKPSDKLIEAYKTFIGESKDVGEREMRSQLEDYSDKQGWGWEGYWQRLKPKKNKEV